jgi:ferredoxin
MSTSDTTTGTIRIVRDVDACVGHGRCYSLAPQIWESDDEGFPELVAGDTFSDPDLIKAARLSAASCPEHAITIEDA